MQTYLFYDIETTGLNKAFDQVLDFAAIRTDLQFNEIERYELKIKLNPDVTPSPYAMITHHMRLSDIAQGMCEYDAIKKIHGWINTPGTISLGYNTMSFDDEFLRFSFYRNLLPPYTHQYANQCSRMDIYPITLMYYLFKNNTLIWPILNGKVSLKLEQLNHANQLATGRAHHAMVDVEATLALAKKLLSEEAMWTYCIGYFNKKSEIDRIQKINDDIALMVLGKFGYDKSFQSIVLSLGNHFHYTNQSLWLRLDDKDFQAITKENFRDYTYVMQKKIAEPGFLLPLKDRYKNAISLERQTLAAANKQWLQENPQLLQLIADYYRDYKYPALPDTDIDASLYLNGFWSQQEEAFCKSFQQAAPKEKASMLELVKNPKLYALGLRIIGRNFPETMTKKQTEEFSQYIMKSKLSNEENAIIDFKGEKRLTPAIAIEQIRELKTTYQSDSEKLMLLDDLQIALQETVAA